ncbi:hypothetical protein C8Q80DRAFT_1125347 [Daedaleopsis nitida]|nr:hypothetical protein C8Q80DRAFT_1125347 [Daedaleopsis nitida]
MHDIMEYAVPLSGYEGSSIGADDRTPRLEIYRHGSWTCFMLALANALLAMLLASCVTVARRAQVNLPTTEVPDGTYSTSTAVYPAILFLFLFLQIWIGYTFLAPLIVVTEPSRPHTCIAAEHQQSGRSNIIDTKSMQMIPGMGPGIETMPPGLATYLVRLTIHMAFCGSDGDLGDSIGPT